MRGSTSGRRRTASLLGGSPGRGLARPGARVRRTRAPAARPCRPRRTSSRARRSGWSAQPSPAERPRANQSCAKRPCSDWTAASGGSPFRRSPSSGRHQAEPPGAALRAPARAKCGRARGRARPRSAPTARREAPRRPPSSAPIRLARPRPPARSARAPTSAVLPIPDSPATSAKPPRPAVAALSAALSSPSSRSRPTKCTHGGAVGVRVRLGLCCRPPMVARPRSTICRPGER